MWYHGRGTGATLPNMATGMADLGAACGIMEGAAYPRVKAVRPHSRLSVVVVGGPATTDFQVVALVMPQHLHAAHG